MYLNIGTNPLYFLNIPSYCKLTSIENQAAQGHLNSVTSNLATPHKEISVSAPHLTMYGDNLARCNKFGIVLL